MLNPDVKRELIKQIDEVLFWIFKVDKWKILYDNLQNSLINVYDAQVKETLSECMDYLYKGQGNIAEEELTYIVTIVEEKLGIKLAEKMENDIKTYQLKSYKKGYESAGVTFSFSQVDQRSLKWLAKDQMYWVGKHYETNLNERLRKINKQILEEGLTREEAGGRLQVEFSGEKEFKRNKEYWSNLANHIITRARTFGTLEGLVKAEVTHYKIQAIIDHRTSEICRHMDGRIISVDDGISLKDKMMNAKSPEEVKLLAPWLKAAEIKNKVVDVPTHKLPKGLGFPPYHWGCRTDVVIATDEEIAAEMKNKKGKKVVKEFLTKISNGTIIFN